MKQLLFIGFCCITFPAFLIVEAFLDSEIFVFLDSFGTYTTRNLFLFRVVRITAKSL